MRFFKTPFALPFLVASTFAQTVLIDSPTPGTTIQAGANYTVQLEYPIYIENNEWFYVALGILSCPSTGCLSPDSGLGPIIGQATYNGVVGPANNIFQNISVSIPASTPSGEANIAVAGFSVAGASYVPGLHFSNVTVYVN
ncbi:hypothetical protein JVU11DRAFT_8688 [Chiua virens]|nr:hypothetical protein JVU11DRAFT_8688 [Chiua virens]